MIQPRDDYMGKAVEGSVQVGESSNDSLQLSLNMELFDPQGKSVGQMTTLLYFTESSSVYSYERLRLLGWTGQGPDDIDKLGNIYTNKVPCRVTAPEQYTAPDGTKKMGSSKLEIIAGAGTIQMAKPLDMGTFKARLKALGGGGSTPATGNGGAPPPF